MSVRFLDRGPPLGLQLTKMGAPKLPPERRRVLIFGRVAPETYERLMQFDGTNIGRKIDTVISMISQSAETSQQSTSTSVS